MAVGVLFLFFVVAVVGVGGVFVAVFVDGGGGGVCSFSLKYKLGSL